MKELSKHIQKPYKGKIVSVLKAVILSKFKKNNNQTPVKTKYQLAVSKAVVGVDLPIKDA